MLIKRTRIHAAVTAAILAAPMGAVAQGGLSLEEVVVTAQKQLQTLQEVPVAVSVMTGDFVAEQNIVDLAGLNQQVPNLVVTRSPFQPVITIRGVGSGGGTRAFEQSVATYVDGVYAGKANQFLNPFFDVERLEVVRGPQGVLFGVNAIAGGINIVNREPSSELEGFISAGYEFENESHRLDGAVSIPLTEDLGVRLSARNGKEGGWLENSVTGDDEPESDYYLYRAVFKWLASENLSVKLSAETGQHETDGSDRQMFQLSPFARSIINPMLEDGRLDFTRSSSGETEYTNIDSDNFALNIDWDVGSHTLTSTTGYSKFDFAQAVLPGSVPIAFGVSYAFEEFDQLYQEFRLQSEGGAFFDYVAGVAYYSQNSDIYQGLDISAPPIPGTAAFGIRNGLEQETTSYAVFGQGTLNFSDELRLVLGLRYSDVEKKADYLIGATAPGSAFDGYAFSPAAAASVVANYPALGWMEYNLVNGTAAPGRWSRTKNLESIDPSLSLQWDISYELGTYITWSQGTKAGGFNDQDKAGHVPELGFADDLFEYDKERARNYEIGAKYAGRNVRINAALFYTEFEDLQVSNSNGNTIVTGNAASVTSKGFEVDYEVLINRYLKVGGDLTLLDAEYDDFPGVGCPVELACTPAQQAQTNAKGNDVEMSPDTTGSFWIESLLPLTSGVELKLRARAYYNSGYYLVANNYWVDQQESFWKYDASIGLQDMGGRWELTLQGKNLGDEAVIGFGGPAAFNLGHNGSVQPGRQIFLDARYNF